MNASRYKKFTIGDYILMSAIITPTVSASAEIIYSDIDPDIVLNDDYEIGTIDMDNDGIIDFAFLKDIGMYATYWSSEFKYFTALWCGPEVFGNEVAGSYFTVGSNASSSFLTYRPYVLPDGFAVNQMLSFQTDGFQLMAYRIFTSEGILWDFGGHWWPEQINQYLGVKFKAGDSEYHYGWVRVSVIDSTAQLIINDYAYEQIPETEIITGNTTGIKNNNIYLPNELMSVTAFDNSLHFECNPMLHYNSFNCEIYDLAGKQVFSKSLAWDTQQLSLDLVPGVYIVYCQAGQQMYTAEIALM